MTVAIVVAIAILAVLWLIYIAWTLVDEVEQLGRIIDDEGEW